MSADITVIKQRLVKHARAEYECMASIYVKDMLSYYCNGDFTFAEMRLIVEARRNGWRIRKGDPYVYQFNKYEGDTLTFRAIQAMHDLCVKYDYYSL